MFRRKNQVEEEDNGAGDQQQVQAPGARKSGRKRQLTVKAKQSAGGDSGTDSSNDEMEKDQTGNGMSDDEASDEE